MFDSFLFTHMGIKKKLSLELHVWYQHVALMRSNLRIQVEQVSIVECQGKIIKIRFMRAAPSVNE